jgi:uncharacterized membrane protein (UPF0182 family)
VSRRRWIVVALASVALVLVVGRALATLYVDYRWYEALGAVALWRARTANTLILRALSAAAGSAFVFTNLWAVRHSVVSLVLPRRVGNIEIGEEVPRRYITAAVLAASLVLGAVLTVPQESWTTLGLWRYGVEFGETDPYFASDLSFYVYWLPLERALYVWAIIALVLVSAVVVFLYALTPSLRWERGTLRVSGYVRRHLTVLGVLLLLLLAWSYRLDAYTTLSDGSGPGGAFTAVDHAVVVPANLGLAALTIAISLVVLWAGWVGQFRVAFAAVTGVIVLSLALRQALPELVRRFGQPADPARREAAYVATGLSFTRRAYGTDHVLPADSALPYATLEQAARLVPIWDPAVLARATTRGASGGAAEETIGWRPAGRDVVGEVVVRPAAADAGGASAVGVAPPTWLVARVLGAAADDHGAPLRVNAAGQPSDDVAALPPVLFADSAGSFPVVSDSAGQLPAADLESWRSRLAHAWSRQDWRFVFGELPQPRPRILLRRGVRERVRALAPFFAQDRTVAPVVHADSLYWMLHLYAASADYPLSQRQLLGEDEWSYFQHAAVAVVNAHTGRVVIVADSVLDPIAETWTRAFPELFGRWASLPAGLDALVPPALDGALVQARAIARCNASPSCSNVLGRTSSVRLAVPGGLDTASTLAGEPLVVLPGTGARNAWIVPLVGTDDRLRGLLVAAGGPEHPVRWYAVDGAAASSHWSAALGRLAGAPDSVAVGTSGVVLRAGRVRALPVAAGVALVEPFFHARADGAASLARVAVAADDSTVRFGPTLAAAVGIAGPHGGADTVAATRIPADFRTRVAALYAAMQAALRRNDLAAFGAAYAQLGALVGSNQGSRAP